jgi:type II secretory pathway component GspD/PulD (secretin)
MPLRHLVISSLVAIAVGGVVSSAAGADALDLDASQTFTIETDKPLETVLLWISRRAGVNIVCNEPDPPRVTLRLTNVTWQEAVDQIATRYDFVVVKKSDRVWELTKPPKVRMQFEDARLSVVLSAIANQAGVNIVISDDVDANRRLTMSLQGVPWREALDVIVKATGYAWVEQQYSIVRVVSPDKLQKDLQTRIFKLNYHAPDSLATVLTSLSGKDSNDMKVVVDSASSSLVVTATPPALADAAKTISTLDSQSREVLIEMKFVEFSNSDAQKLGFDPINTSFNLKGIGTVSPTFTPFNDSFGGGVAYATRDSSGNVPSSTGGFSASFSFEALATLASAEVLQAPQLLTVDNRPATIKIGSEIRYAESTTSEATGSTSSTVTTTLKEAQGSPVKDGIEITVLPHITSDGMVQIKLGAKNEAATLKTFTNGQVATSATFSSIQLPQKDTTSLDNEFRVADGKTAVIGGILNNKASESNSQVPALGSIPVIGWLFKKQTSSVTQRNLTIFITPHIIPINDDKSDHEASLLRQREELSGLKLTPQPEAAKTQQNPE